MKITKVPEINRKKVTPVAIVDDNFEVYEDESGLFRIYDNVAQVWERPRVTIEACLKRCESLVANYWFVNLP